MLNLVVDRAGQEAIRARARRIWGGDNQFETQWLTHNDCYVLPQESALHFDEDQSSRLSMAFERSGVASLVAVPTENGDFDYWELESSPKALLLFSHECGSFDYLLMPKVQAESAIFCSHNDYLLVAGTCNFLADYAGDVERSIREFERFSESEMSATPGSRTQMAPAIAYSFGARSARHCGRNGRS